MRRRLTICGLLVLATAALLAQSATYPAGVVSFTTKTAGQTIQSAHINTIQAEITAVENALLNGLAHIVKPLTDATYDLGTVAARWRDGFFSRNVTIGGTLTAPALVGGWTIVTSTSTGTLNDFAPGLVGNTVLRMNNATLATITGFSGGADGQLVEVQSVGAGQVDTSHQDTASTTAADRLINIAASGHTSAAAGAGTLLYRYDGTTARWRLVQHTQGAWIAYVPTYSGNAAMTFTSVGTTLMRYWLKDREMVIAFDVSGTVGGTPNTALQFTLPLTFTQATGGFVVYGANLTGAGLAQMSGAGNTTIGFFKDMTAAGNWSAGTARLVGTIPFEVQD